MAKSVYFGKLIAENCRKAEKSLVTNTNKEDFVNAEENQQPSL